MCVCLPSRTVLFRFLCLLTCSVLKTSSPACGAGLQSRHEESALAQRARSGKRGGGEPTSWRDNDVAVPVPATGRTLAAAHATSSMRVARGSVAKGRISESDRREVVERAAGLLRRKQAAGQQAALTEDDIDRVVSSVVVRRRVVCANAEGLRGRSSVDLLSPFLGFQSIKIWGWDSSQFISGVHLQPPACLTFPSFPAFVAMRARDRTPNAARPALTHCKSCAAARAALLPRVPHERARRPHGPGAPAARAASDARLRRWRRPAPAQRAELDEARPPSQGALRALAQELDARTLQLASYDA